MTSSNILWGGVWSCVLFASTVHSNRWLKTVPWPAPIKGRVMCRLGLGCVEFLLLRFSLAPKPPHLCPLLYPQLCEGKNLNINVHKHLPKGYTDVYMNIYGRQGFVSINNSCIALPSHFCFCFWPPWQKHFSPSYWCNCSRIGSTI